MNLKALSNQELTLKLEAAATRERRATVEVIAHIHEFMVRRLYLEHGCTSLFAYLTTHLHFSEATAQNRIDTARMLNETPELAEKISKGVITLTQVSVVAQAMRQRRRDQKSELTTSMRDDGKSETDSFARTTDAPTPLALFSAIEGLDTKRSTVVIARKLDIKPVAHEKVRPQQDESVRLEITLTKEEWTALRQARDLLSHRNPSASISDVIAEVTKYFVQREDPRIARSKKIKFSTPDSTPEQPPNRHATSDPKLIARPRKRTAIPRATRRLIFARDLCCQWPLAEAGEKCGSTFLLQIDHRVSVCAGGSNEPDNLQLLCAAHNRWKFEHA